MGADQVGVLHIAQPAALLIVIFVYIGKTMFSVRIPGKLFPVLEDVSESDMDTDVEEYNYDGRFVFRGNIDPDHSTSTVQVYWLYDQNSKRVGVAEHEGEEHSTLWFKSNVFGTLLQEDWEAQDRTIWSLMSQAAYEDCMKHGWTTIQKVAERTNLNLVTPSDIINGVCPIQKCTRCLGETQERCLTVKNLPRIDVYSTVFVDEDGVLFTPPSDSTVYATLRRRMGLTSEESGAAVGAAVGAGAAAAGAAT